MEILQTKDGTIFKFIHPNFAETAIKDVGGCSGLSADASTKYSVFASCSYGCKMACKFCMLHTKGVAYRELPVHEVVENTHSAILFAATNRPSIKKKKIKLSWMGMGEGLLHPDVLKQSRTIVQSALDAGCASGFDCVDIGTSFPKVNLQDTVGMLQEIEAGFSDISEERGPDGRPVVRLFVSIGALEDRARTFLMGSGGFSERLDELRRVWGTKSNIVCHTLLLSGVNDSDRDAERLLAFFRNRPEVELRLLRYNQCSGSPFVESANFEEISQLLLERLDKVKVQRSPGSEIMAACGQFLV